MTTHSKVLNNQEFCACNQRTLNMGGIMSYFRGFFGSREMRILILGLDGAGKTTLLYRLQVGEVVTTIPTIGFNVEQVCQKVLAIHR